MNKRRRQIALWMVLIVPCVVIAVVLMAQSALADPPRPEPTPTSSASWPERPKPTPTPKLPSQGGAILLSVSGAASPYYAVVQWQDGLGEWHDVDGWRGEVKDDRVLWYVAPKDFGTGPFGWVVYNDQEIIGISESFYLPTDHGQIVQVVVTVRP